MSRVSNGPQKQKRFLAISYRFWNQFDVTNNSSFKKIIRLDDTRTKQRIFIYGTSTCSHILYTGTGITTVTTKHLLSTRVLGKLIPVLTKGTGRLKQAAHVAES